MKDNRCFRLSHVRIAVCVLLAVLWAGWVTGSGAYLTDAREKVNVLLAADTKIRIDENFEPPQDPVPGSWFVKEPRIVNDSSVACYVRARICFSSLEGESCCQPLQLNEGWMRAADGYWYYDRLLAGGQATEPLFSRVTFRGDISQEELEAALPFDIFVYAEAAASVQGERVWSRMDGEED